MAYSICWWSRFHAQLATIWISRIRFGYHGTAAAAAWMQFMPEKIYFMHIDKSTAAAVPWIGSHVNIIIMAINILYHYQHYYYFSYLF